MDTPSFMQHPDGSRARHGRARPAPSDAHGPDASRAYSQQREERGAGKVLRIDRSSQPTGECDAAPFPKRRGNGAACESDAT